MFIVKRFKIKDIGVNDRVNFRNTYGKLKVIIVQYYYDIIQYRKDKNLPEKTTTRKSKVKKILKRDLVSNRKYRTTYKDIKKYFNIINKSVFKNMLIHRLMILRLKNL